MADDDDSDSIGRSLCKKFLPEDDLAKASVSVSELTTFKIEKKQNAMTLRLG